MEPICCDCGTSAPKTDTAHTLIGAKHGWRLSRTRTATGEYELKWRCPRCWAKYKADQAGESPPAPSGTRVAEAPPSSEQRQASDAERSFDRALSALRSIPPKRGR